jgi:hypothetical protein
VSGGGAGARAPPSHERSELETGDGAGAFSFLRSAALPLLFTLRQYAPLKHSFSQGMQLHESHLRSLGASSGAL